MWKSIDRRTGEIVALKKIFDAFTNATDAQRTYREIMFLQVSEKHAYIYSTRTSRTLRIVTCTLTQNQSYTSFHETVSCGSLQEFSSHENVIQLLNVIRARNDQDIYLVFEFMDTDLHAVIKAKILQPVHIQYIMYQVHIYILYTHLYVYVSVYRQHIYVYNMSIYIFWCYKYM